MATVGTFPYCPPGLTLYTAGTGTIKCYDPATATYSLVQVTEGVLVTPQEYGAYEWLISNIAALENLLNSYAVPEAFDPEFAGQMWLTGLGFIVMLYGTAAGVGYALKLFKGSRNSP